MTFFHPVFIYLFFISLFIFIGLACISFIPQCSSTSLLFQFPVSSSPTFSHVLCSNVKQQLPVPCHSSHAHKSVLILHLSSTVYKSSYSQDHWSFLMNGQRKAQRAERTAADCAIPSNTQSCRKEGAEVQSVYWGLLNDVIFCADSF